MGRRIAIVDGHPDTRAERFVHALVHAYADGACAAGHEVRIIEVGSLDFPWLRTTDEFRSGRPPGIVRTVQETLAWAEHWLIVYPLWLGSMPALLKAFFEQVARPGFAFDEAAGRRLPRRLLAGRSARVVVTMGMPEYFYRGYYRAHSLKSLERNILGFVGISPVRATIVGRVGEGDRARHARVLARMRRMGARAA